MATATNDKPVRLGDLPVVKTNILENARQFDKGVVGGYSGTFPLTAASQDGIYLLPSTGKFYVCETAYNGVQISAPNSNFVELSVWKNHDRLSNLVGFYIFNDDVFEISMNLLTIVTFNTSKNQNEVLLNLNKIFKNRKKGQRLLIMINTVSSLKPNITEFFYNGEPGDITSQSEYWSAKQTNRRYDSIEFIVGSDKNFYLIANNGFTIIKK